MERQGSDGAAEAGAQQVLADGFTILRDVIPAAFVRELRDTLEAELDRLAIPRGSNSFLGEKTRRLFNLLARHPIFERVPLHEPVLSVVDRVLDEECLLSSLTGVHMGPGETAQPIHADDGSVSLPKPHVPTSCTAIWALTDFTAENGGTNVIPGSHLRDRSPKRGDVHEPEPTVMSAGSALVYHGSLWHGGGANDSSLPRIGIICNYTAGFMRQEECQLLAIPQDRVATFPPRLRKLVGYGTYRGLLGHVDQQDPATLLDPSVETDMVWKRIKA